MNGKNKKKIKQKETNRFYGYYCNYQLVYICVYIFIYIRYASTLNKNDNKN